MSIVTLITDYGTKDYYVGAMKGVMLSIKPNLRMVDITHEIAPHHVAHGAFVLWQSLKWFPRSTVHLVVVDPSVGTKRRAIVARCNGQLVVAPDNGLLTFAYKELPIEEVRSLENRDYAGDWLSSTFHGRDLFAPAAAHLAANLPMKELGPIVDDIELLPLDPIAKITGRTVEGQVLYVDRFGTLVTNIWRGQLVEMGVRFDQIGVEIDGQLIGTVHTTFGDVPPGESVALIGSCGLLEIGVNQGSASERFGTSGCVRVGVKV